MTGTPNRPSIVLVTGAAGFIGSTLCRTLLSSGRRVVGYDDLSRGRREFLPPGMPLVEGDIRDGTRMRDTVEAAAPDLVVHLAAMHFIPDCIARPADTMDVNVEGTRRVLDSCRGSSVRRVVVASTGAVYAPSDAPCHEERTSIGPLEVYGESKLAAEQLVANFQRETGVSATVLRLFNAIGRNETNPHVVPHIFESVRASDTIRLGNVAPRRDYIDTRDIADAILASAEGPDGLSVFNVGTGVAWSVQDIVERLAQVLGRDLKIESETARKRTTERMLLVADPDSIRRATGWTPRFRLEESLSDLVRFYGLRSVPPTETVRPPASHRTPEGA
jgi:UDP-glucose 4-epimerase